ncbi:hypothetical protein V8C42DRAFT_337249 [Trichoderma barbatum]
MSHTIISKNKLVRPRQQRRSETQYKSLSEDLLKNVSPTSASTLRKYIRLSLGHIFRVAKVAVKSAIRTIQILWAVMLIILIGLSLTKASTYFWLCASRGYLYIIYHISLIALSDPRFNTNSSTSDLQSAHTKSNLQ